MTTEHGFSLKSRITKILPTANIRGGVGHPDRHTQRQTDRHINTLTWLLPSGWAKKNVLRLSTRKQFVCQDIKEMHFIPSAILDLQNIQDVKRIYFVSPKLY